MLGNAHLTNFFVNNENVSELELALKAYSQTERNLKDYNLAHSIDPNLKGDYKSGLLINFVIQTANFVQSRGKS